MVKLVGLTMSRRPIPTPESQKQGIDFGWRTHGAITDWTAKVDSKASIVLSVGGVMLGFFVTLSAGNRLLAHLHGWRLIVERTGLGVTAVGVLMSALVVAPRLNRRKTRRTWRTNFVYFGHLRHWDAKDLRKKLASLTDDEEIEVLSNQLIATSKIAWYKHSLLQLAIFALIVGVLAVTLSVIWFK